MDWCAELALSNVRVRWLPWQSCSWYCAVCIIVKVNYQVMLQEQFDQMALILVDVCESYWPYSMRARFFGTRCILVYVPKQHRVLVMINLTHLFDGKVL